MVQRIHHIQIRVPENSEQETIHFYGEILGLRRIPQPDIIKKNGGAWFEISGGQELHIGIEELDNQLSRRHLCFQVEHLDQTRKQLEEHGITILPDEKPITLWKRFYLRDPGGNRVEIAEVPPHSNTQD